MRRKIKRVYLPVKFSVDAHALPCYFRLLRLPLSSLPPPPENFFLATPRVIYLVEQSFIRAIDAVLGQRRRRFFAALQCAGDAVHAAAKPMYAGYM